MNPSNHLLYIENGVKLRNWIDENYLNWTELSTNPLAIRLLEKNLNKIDWVALSSNPSATHLLEKNIDLINWNMLCLNPSATRLLTQYPEKINWILLSQNESIMQILKALLLSRFIDNKEKLDYYLNQKLEIGLLCLNPSAIELLEKTNKKLNWTHLSSNPSAIHLLEQNKSNIDWRLISRNPAIFELDYDFLHQRMNIIRKELMEKTWHPDRFRKWCLDIDEFKELC